MYTTKIIFFLFPLKPPRNHLLERHGASVVLGPHFEKQESRALQQAARFLDAVCSKIKRPPISS
jgi:hypothetical protein